MQIIEMPTSGSVCVCVREHKRESVEERIRAVASAGS